jgi:hypothetical protein
LYDVNFSLAEYNGGAPTSNIITFSGDIITTCNQCFLGYLPQSDVYSYQFNFSGPGVNGSISSSANSAGNPIALLMNASPSNAYPLVALPTGIYFDPVVASGIAAGHPVPSPGSNIFLMEPTAATFSNKLILSFSGGNPDTLAIGPTTPNIAVAGAGVIALFGPGTSTEDLLGDSGIVYPSNEIIAAFSGCTIALTLNGEPNCLRGPVPGGLSLVDLGPVFRGGIDIGENFQLDRTILFVPSATPLPAALPLFATGLGAMALFGRRRKRKKTASLAA